MAQTVHIMPELTYEGMTRLEVREAGFLLFRSFYDLDREDQRAEFLFVVGSYEKMGWIESMEVSDGSL